MPTDLTDEQIAEAIAEEVAARIGKRPLSRRFLRQLVALYTRQALGVLPPPAEISDAVLGEQIGLNQQRVSETRSIALDKLLHHHGDELREFIQ